MTGHRLGRVELGPTQRVTVVDHEHHVLTFWGYGLYEEFPVGGRIKICVNTVPAMGYMGQVTVIEDITLSNIVEAFLDTLSLGHP